MGEKISIMHYESHNALTICTKLYFQTKTVFRIIPNIEIQLHLNVINQNIYLKRLHTSMLNFQVDMQCP